MSILGEIESEAREFAAQSQSWGNRNHASHDVLGVLAIVAGLLAGSSGFAEWSPAITGAAGFGAALLAGLQSFLRSEDKARYHWDIAADLSDIALEARQFAGREAPPSEDEVTMLRQRLLDVRRRRFSTRHDR